MATMHHNILWVSDTLAFVKSESAPFNHWYKVEDGRCECKAAQYEKRCKHVNAIQMLNAPYKEDQDGS